MRKTRLLLVYIGSGLMLVAVFLSLFHLRDNSRFLRYLSVYLFLITTIIGLISPKDLITALPQYTDEYNGYKKAYYYVLNIGSFLALTGLLFKMMHFPGGFLLLVSGFIIIFVSYILIMSLEFGKKKYVRVIDNPDFKVAVEDLARYTGSYFSGALNMTMNIWEKDERLTAQVVGQGPFPLTAVKKDIFNYKPIGAVIEIYPEKAELVLIQHGSYMPFVKKDLSLSAVI